MESQYHKLQKHSSHNAISSENTSDSGYNYGTPDAGSGSQDETEGSTESSGGDSLECVHNEREAAAFHYVSQDDMLLKALNFGKNDKEMDAEAFKKLASKSGFQFGECFSLIEHAWSAENKALVRLKIPKAIAEDLSSYVIHPCIIDASLQSCIAIGSTDPERNVIPIGMFTFHDHQFILILSCW